MTDVHQINGYRSSDNKSQPIRIDESTNSLQIIDYGHHEVHSGNSFYFCDVVALGDSEVQDYLIETPDSTKWSHFGAEVTFNDGAGTVEIYEETDRVGITPQTIFNRDRNSSTTETLTIHKGQGEGTTDGSKILWSRVGSGKNTSGIPGTSEELILKQNAKYILRVINSTTSTNNTSVILRWYEHAGIS